MITANNLSKAGLAQIASVNELANNAKTQSQKAIDYTKQGLDALKGADPSESTQKMRDYGDSMATIAGQLPSTATKVSESADKLSAISGNLTDAGNDYLGISQDLLNMNKDSSSEFVKEILSLYGQYDPDRKVALAAQDVQNSFDNANDQQSRELSRQGVTAGSGRSNALKQQYKIALATQLAAIKTRTRSTSLDEQTAAFNNLISGNAKSLSNLAKDYLLSGANVEASAAGANAQAASILSTSANIFGQAASVEQSAANLDLGYAGQVAAQDNNVASAYRAYSSLLDSQSARELSFLNADLSRATQVVKMDFSGTDESDPWEATGHTSTYWKNRLSSSDFADLASKIGISANLGSK